MKRWGKILVRPRYSSDRSDASLICHGPCEAGLFFALDVFDSALSVPMLLSSFWSSWSDRRRIGLNLEIAWMQTSCSGESLNPFGSGDVRLKKALGLLDMLRNRVVGELHFMTQGWEAVNVLAS